MTLTIILLRSREYCAIKKKRLPYEGATPHCFVEVLLHTAAFSIYSLIIFYFHQRQPSRRSCGTCKIPVFRFQKLFHGERISFTFSDLDQCPDQYAVFLLQEAFPDEFQIDLIRSLDDMDGVQLAYCRFPHARISAEAPEIMFTPELDCCHFHGGSVEGSSVFIEIFPVKYMVGFVLADSVKISLLRSIVAAVESGSCDGDGSDTDIVR